jgi:hypothetical protein
MKGTFNLFKDNGRYRLISLWTVSGIRRLVNHHRQKIVDIGYQTFFHSLFFPPLEKGGKGGFDDWKSPSIPLKV